MNDLDLIREISVLKQLNNPGILRILDVWVEKKRKVCMKTDFFQIDLGRLVDSSKFSFTETDVQYVMFRIMSAVHYLHENKFIHRDIKPPNFLVNEDGDVVLIDFGLARKIGSPGEAMTKQVVTRWYKPPELLYGDVFYNEKLDIWSCGCVMAELYLKDPLFKADSDIKQLASIFSVRGTPTATSWPSAKDLPNFFPFAEQPEVPLQTLLKGASAEAVKLIEWMLQLDPTKRPTSKQVLESPFFSKSENYKTAFAGKIKAHNQSKTN